MYTRLKHIPRFGVWALIVAKSASAFAQNDSSADDERTIVLEDILVVGKHASLASAQEIKRDKMEIVDSVVADDINKLPDINVTDALSRITGVQILRDRGEGAGVAIRGLTQMETLLNGREVFTAGSGRTLDFADIPSEMLAGIDVYKTSSANHIEGGVGGTIDLRTHRPFDFKGRQLLGSARVIHGDLVNDERPQFSTLFSDRWQTETFGEFGALLSAAYQQRAWREDQDSFGNPKTISLNGQTAVAANGAIDTITRGQRERIGGSMILQWRPNEKWDLYAEAHHAQFKTWQDGYQLFMNPSGSFDAASVSLFPGSRDVQSMTWTNPGISNWGSARDTLDRTSQLAVGGSWNRGALTLKSDLSYTQSHNNLFYSVITRNGTATSLRQDVSGLSTALTGAGFDSAGMVYASRPFDGALWAGQLDGEYNFGNRFINTLSAGLRYARRDATDAPGQVVFSSPNVPAANASGLTISSPYSDFPVGSPAAARDVEAVRNALGITSAIPTSNPLGTWAIAEDTHSGYLMAHFKGSNQPVDGNFGVRVVETRDQVSGYQSLPGTGGTSPIALDNTYLDALPSINLRYELMKGLFLRGAASKLVTRPDFNQLSPSLTLNSVQRNGSAGNPELKPIRSDNFDVAVEKYFNPTTSVYITGFFKQVNGFVTTVSNPEVHDGFTYQVSRPQNGTDATINGFETGYQQFYDFLPNWFSGLGIQANYTYIDSETPSTILGQNVPLQNLSKHSYNLVGMYEKGPFSARVAYNWRDTFLSGVTNVVGVGALPIYTSGYGWLDASVGYRINEHFSFTIEGMNLLNTLRRSYYGVETRPQSVWVNDTQVGATMTVRF
ncbi:MAG TPA: TonB-dependent receptor [Methylobacter sp.]|jgi:TonB-dependent receptor